MIELVCFGSKLLKHLHVHAERHHGIKRRVSGKLRGKRIERAAQALHFLRSHTAGNVECEYYGERSRLATALFHLEKRERLFDVIHEDFEVCMLQVSYR